MNWYYQMKIGTRLIAAFVVAGAITVIVGCIGVFNMGAITELTKQSSEVESVGLSYMNKANVFLFKSNLATKDIGLAKNKEDLAAREARVNKYFNTFEDCIAQAKPYMRTAKENELVAQLEQAWQESRKANARYTALLENAKSDPTISLAEASDNVRSKSSVVEGYLGQLIDLKSQLLKSANEQTQKTYWRSRTILIGWMVGGVVLCLSLGVIIAMTISKPLGAIADAASKIAKGDVNQKIEYQAGDEVGSLADSFRALIEYIQDVAGGLEKLAASDPTASVASRSSADLIAENFARAAESVRAFSESVSAVGVAIKDEGRLNARVDINEFSGQFRSAAEILNGTLDALYLPIQVMAGMFEAISRGEIPEKSAEVYKGELLLIKQRVDHCIDNLAVLVEISRSLQCMAVNDCTVQVTGDREGVFGEISKSTNDVQTQFKHIVSALDGLAKGDFKALLNEYKNIGRRSDNDELVPALVRTMSSIEALVADADVLADAAAAGKITVRADAAKHQGDYRRVVDGMNRTLEAIAEPLRAAAENAQALAASSEELTAVSQQMSGNAEETAAQANVVSAASEQVSKNVASVATASEEMQASIREISKNANESARVAKSAVTTAESTNETMKKLGESSQEIGNVIKVITSIAQQTNLLALNATIEAARAGEAGKGFAVVANEVKELAKQTAKATEEIGQKIEAIQEVTVGAVSAIEDISAVINQINDISNSIASAVEEQTVTTNEIGRSVNEAAQGVNNIAKNIGGVAVAAKNTTMGANDTKSASLGLSEMAARLQAAVAKFTF